MLLNDLKNDFQMGRDEYPKTLMAAYDLSINLKGDTKGPSVSPNDGVAFAIESEEVDVHATNGINMTRSMLRSAKIGVMTLTMVVRCSAKLWWTPQRQKKL